MIKWANLEAVIAKPCHSERMRRISWLTRTETTGNGAATERFFDKLRMTQGTQAPCFLLVFLFTRYIPRDDPFAGRRGGFCISGLQFRFSLFQLSFRSSGQTDTRRAKQRIGLRIPAERLFIPVKRLHCNVTQTRFRKKTEHLIV